MADKDTLLVEYEYLAQEHRHHNWLIHTTWYLDIILIAGGIQFTATNTLPNSLHILTAVFAMSVFGGLGVYTYLQIQRRMKVKRRKRAIEDLLSRDVKEQEYETIDTLKAGFLITVFYIFPMLSVIPVIIISQ